MNRLSANLKLDVQLQWRNKLYAIGIAVAILFGLVARFSFDRTLAGPVLASFYLLGLGGTTYMFGASLVVLEKTQGTLDALRTSTLTATIYIASKAITLTAFAVVESAIVYAIGFYGVPMNPLAMLAGLVFLGVFYTLVGLGQVAPHDAITSFLIPGALLVGMVLQLPFLYVLKVGPPVIWYFIPTQGTLLLMLGAFQPLAWWQWIYAISVSLASIAAAMWWARRRFARHIALPEAS